MVLEKETKTFSDISETTWLTFSIVVNRFFFNQQHEVTIPHPDVFFMGWIDGLAGNSACSTSIGSEIKSQHLHYKLSVAMLMPET